MIEYILNPQTIEALGWTLLHSIWQGAAFAILLVLILIALRSYSAQSRYVVSVGLLSAFFLTLSTTFWLQWQSANSVEEVTMQQTIIQPTNNDFQFHTIPQEALISEGESKSTLAFNNKIFAIGQSTWLVGFRDYYKRHLPLLVTIWFLGILFLQLRLLGQLAYVQRLKHYGAQLIPISWNDKIEELEGTFRIQKKVQYLTSIRIESPMVIGWLKPVVLLPRQLFNSLSETEIYAVLAHELAHIRREDFIVNLMQTLLCNVFFFHPGVWWMSNRINDEREHCCDDLAVAATGPATSYAKTLINVSELQLRMQRNPQLAMALSGKSKRNGRVGFSGRIRRLFRVKNGAGSFREGFATAFILITALFLGVIATGSTVHATDSTMLSEITQKEITSESPTPNNIDLKQQTKVKTTIRTENNPISNTREGFNQSELPVAAIATPAKPIEVISPSESRIDALVMACGDGDFDFVKTLIKSGININGIGSDGFTPLMMATSNNEAEIVEYLLKKGANVNQIINGWTALIEAADEGALASMKHLLDAGAKVNFYWTAESPTAITMAASEGKLDCLKLLLANGADINGIGKSIPPLHIAAEEGKRVIIDYLISQKVNLNKKDAAGRTALMYASSEGQKLTVKILMDAGANKSLVDLNGDSATNYAEEEDQYDIRDYLNNENEHHYDSPVNSGTVKRPEIHQATLDGHIEKVKQMVERGTNVNTTDAYGRTPLHIASAAGHNIDMRVLIDLGANINAQDKQGRTPLMYAAADGKGDAVALLVSKVANVNLSDVDGMTAYDWARSGGKEELANFLGLITENKKWKDNNVNYKNTQQKDFQKEVEKSNQKEIRKDPMKRESVHVTEDGIQLKQFDIEETISEFLTTVRNGNVNDISKLLSMGLSINSTDDTGQTALMVAASSNRIDNAKYLIENGADVNMSSSSGLTALHYTALENHDQMARLLLKNNAKLDPTMRYSSTDGNSSNEALVWEYIGATPLLIAVESKNIKVLSVLINAGANTNHSLIRNQYKLNKNRTTYLGGSEVMGLDEDFLDDAKFQNSDKNWTPHKSALLLNEPEILAFFLK